MQQHDSLDSTNINVGRAVPAIMVAVQALIHTRSSLHNAQFVGHSPTYPAITNQVMRLFANADLSPESEGLTKPLSATLKMLHPYLLQKTL